MGCYFTRGAKKADIVKQLTTSFTSESFKHETLAHKVVGNTLWAVHCVTENGVPATIIGCYLLSSRGGWGYKPMCEAMHPYYYTCPLAYLAMTPMACQEWRDKVVAHHQAKNAS